jgi:hypothetical protein
MAFCEVIRVVVIAADCSEVEVIYERGVYLLWVPRAEAPRAQTMFAEFNRHQLARLTPCGSVS